MLCFARHLLVVPSYLWRVIEKKWKKEKKKRKTDETKYKLVFKVDESVTVK